MVARPACTRCGAPGPLAGHACHYCGATQVTPVAPGAEDPAVSNRPTAPIDRRSTGRRQDPGTLTGDGADLADDDPMAMEVEAGPGLAGRAPAGDARSGVASETEAGLGLADRPREAVAGDRAPAREARRFQGLAVPLVAAAVVVGIGYPLTALAVSQVGRLPATTTAVEGGPGVPQGSGSGAGLGEARLSGAITFVGPVTPVGCSGALPRLVTVGSGGDRFSILLNVPAGARAGTYPLAAATNAFVAVSRLAGPGETWTSLNVGRARGEVTVADDQSVSARFSGLAPVGGGAEDEVAGTVQVRCG